MSAGPSGLARGMLRGLRYVAAGLGSLGALAGRVHRRRAVALTVVELRELENSFVLLLNGSLAGLPSPPAFLAAELLPYLEHELRVAASRAEKADDALAEMVGMLDMG